jgi:hypothetical protein
MKISGGPDRYSGLQQTNVVGGLQSLVGWIEQISSIATGLMSGGPTPNNLYNTILIM